ncbi:hypothetical protein [Metabacillus sp. Hm71]|uniref:hypothetical protein n=1 Tax=Metabacillus sp. Hm71 TaxID=3450743 RepID=UPI003F423474
MGLLKRLADYEMLLKDLEERVKEEKQFKEHYKGLVVEKDAELENYKRSIEITREALEQLTKENEALREVIRLWA